MTVTTAWPVPSSTPMARMAKSAPTLSATPACDTPDPTVLPISAYDCPGVPVMVADTLPAGATMSAETVSVGWAAATPAPINTKSAAEKRLKRNIRCIVVPLPGERLPGVPAFTRRKRNDGAGSFPHAERRGQAGASSLGEAFPAPAYGRCSTNLRMSQA